MTDDEPDWSTVVVPDDAGSLEADELALRRERAAHRRRARLRRVTGGERFRAYGITASVVVVAFVTVAVFGGLLVLLGPRTRTTPGAAPVGPSPTAPAGRPGGLLPDEQLTQADGASIDIRALSTPEAILLVPAGCGCTRTLTVAVDAAVRQDLRAVVVEPTAGGAPAGSPDAVTYTDRPGRLLATYGSLGSAPTLLLVDDEGAVRSVEVGLTTQSLSTLLAAGLDG